MKRKFSADYRSFFRQFRNGQEFWTSEDGLLLSIAVINSPRWEDVLKKEFARIIKDFDPARAMPRFAYREWVGADFFDGGTGQKRGKIWRLGDDKTPFGVIEYPLLPNYPPTLGTFTDGDGVERACRYLGPPASDYEEEWGLMRIAYSVNGKRMEGAIRPFEFNPTKAKE